MLEILLILIIIGIASQDALKAILGLIIVPTIVAAIILTPLALMALLMIGVFQLAIP